MPLALKFITALAWIIGAGCAGTIFLVLLIVFSADDWTDNDGVSAEQLIKYSLLIGILPWAWILALHIS